MTNEEKELLLKDLCARLPYGVYILVHDTFEYSTVPFKKVYLKSSDISFLIDSISLNERYNSKDKRFNRIIKERKDFLEFKPYLFPLSSMTEEQKKEYRKACELDTEILENHPMDGSPFPAMYNSQDWLDAHHFDYRGLIPMGLANDATGLNIY